MSMRRTLAVGAAIAAVLGLTVAGGATAGKLIGSPQIKDGGVYSPDLHDGGVRSADLRNGGIGLADLSPFLKDQLDGGGCMSTAGVDFALNSGDWIVRGGPFSEPTTTIAVDNSRKAGVVHMATYPRNGGYADAGVIVSLGTVGENFEGDAFQMPSVRGPYTDQVAVNLYVDVNTDGEYLEFSDSGEYIGEGGDQILFSVGDSTSRTELETVTDDTALWAWVGVSGSDVQSAALTRFAGQDLAIC